MIRIEKFEKTPIRQLRVAELIKEVVAQIISQKIIDDKIFYNSFISVTKVKISPDLQNATIFISAFPSNDTKALVDRMNQINQRFRSIINDKVKLRFSPKILFRYDNTQEEVDKINKLLDSVASGNKD